MGKLHRFFFYLTIVLLPTQLGLHFWPQWASVLGRRIDYLSPTIYVTDVLIFLVLSSWSIELLKTRHSRGGGNPSSIKTGSPIKSGMTRGTNFILVLLFVGINVFLATNKPVALFHWLKVLECALLGYYSIRTKPSTSVIIYLLSLAIFYSSLIAILQFILQHSIGGPFWFLGERTFTNQSPGIAQINWCFPNVSQCRLLLRPYATFPHPNVLGGFLAITLPLLINQLTNKKITRLFFSTTILLGIIALALTFSRSAWIIGLLGIGWVLFHFKPKFFIPFAIIIFLLLGILIKNFDPVSESVVVRQQLNSAAITMWRASPLFGVGLGNFLVELPKNLPSRTIYFLQPVHNIYLLLLSETGIVGLGSFLLLLWYIFQRIRNSKFKTSIVALLLLGLVDHYLLTLQQGQLLFTLFLSLSLLKKFDPAGRD